MATILSQAQLAAIFASLPAQGCADCFDGQPDTAWVGAHSWGQLAGLLAQGSMSWERPEGWTGEYRFYNDKWILYHDWTNDTYAPVQVLSGASFVGEFVTLVTPLVSAAFSAVVMASEAAAAASTAESVAAMQAAQESFAVSEHLAENLAAQSTIAENIATEGFDMSALNQWEDAFAVPDFTTAAAPDFTPVADYSVDFSAADLGLSTPEITLAPESGYSVDLGIGDIGLSTPDITIAAPDISIVDAFPSLDHLDWSQLFKTATSALKIWQSSNSPTPKYATPVQTSAGTVVPNKNGSITTTSPTGNVTLAPMPVGQPFTFPDGTTVQNNGNGTYTVTRFDGTTNTMRYPSAMTGINPMIVYGGLGLVAALLISQ